MDFFEPKHSQTLSLVIGIESLSDSTIFIFKQDLLNN